MVIVIVMAVVLLMAFVRVIVVCVVFLVFVAVRVAVVVFVVKFTTTVVMILIVAYVIPGTLGALTCISRRSLASLVISILLMPTADGSVLSGVSLLT